jgi:hypothetical protein
MAFIGITLTPYYISISRESLHKICELLRIAHLAYHLYPDLEMLKFLEFGASVVTSLRHWERNSAVFMLGCLLRVELP